MTHSTLRSLFLAAFASLVWSGACEFAAANAVAVSGTVSDEGKPAAGVKSQRAFRIVHLGDLLDARMGSVSDGSEQIAIRALKPGHYIFELQGEAGRITGRAGPVEVKPGAPPIDVTLTAKSTNSYSQSTGLAF